MEDLLSEYVHVDGMKVSDKIIAIGGTNVVIQKKSYAVKIPRLVRYTNNDGAIIRDESSPPQEGNYDYRGQLIQALANEKAIYQRIGSHDGVCACYNLSSEDPALYMKQMKQDLRRFLKTNRPNQRQQLAWLLQLAKALNHIHSRRVIVADVNTSNVVIDEEFNVFFIDFSESTLMPLNWDLEGSDEHGYSILSDIGQFGSLMFQVTTGQDCDFSLEDTDTNASGLTWPRRESLPPTETLWLGATIEKCWTQCIKDMEEVVADLEQVKILQESEGNTGKVATCSNTGA